MKQNKLYILAYENKLSPKSFKESPVAWIGRATIKLCTWSQINHISHTYRHRNCHKLINQAAPKGFESINYLKDFTKRDANIYAYPVTVDFDIQRVHEFTLSKRGAKYDWKGAGYSAIDGSLFGKLYKIVCRIEKDDNPEFCSEIGVELFKHIGYLKHITNENTINPKELVRQMKKYALCGERIHVWDGKRIINNIWEV